MISAHPDEEEAEQENPRNLEAAESLPSHGAPRD